MTCNPSCQCCKGACCCGASCTQETCQDCEDGHGVWSGPGTQCGSPSCSPPTGACCGEACAILSECECLQAGGEYQGDDTTCSPDPCGETVCSGPCDEENPCPEGCYCCQKWYVSQTCEYLCPAFSPGCAGFDVGNTYGPFDTEAEAIAFEVPPCAAEANNSCCQGDPEDSENWPPGLGRLIPSGENNVVVQQQNCQSVPCCSGSCDEENPCPPGCVCCSGQCVSADSAYFFCRTFYGNPCDFTLPVGVSDVFEPGDFDCPEGFFKYYDGIYTQCTKCLPCPDGSARVDNQPDPQVWPCDCGGDCYQDAPASGPCSSMFGSPECSDPTAFCLCGPNPLP